MSVSFDLQKNMVLSLTLTTVTLIVGIVLMQVGHGQTTNNNSEKNEDAARTYLSCYNGSMSTLMLQNLVWSTGNKIQFN